MKVIGFHLYMVDGLVVQHLHHETREEGRRCLSISTECIMYRETIVLVSF